MAGGRTALYAFGAEPKSNVQPNCTAYSHHDQYSVGLLAK